ncbi:PQQ-dependent sugar dehydrogenase [Flavobacterium luteum]|uniref:PQQ-dependent sugar dehydrogenase n=1 Tax=Flavobacterium luteum TaxID=2026654 RepID=UPI0021D00F82|nr:PQQ-dependent sugar dehydrogenase [Flavobacterium luteum]
MNYTNTSGHTVIARYSVSADSNVADVSSSSIILTVNQPFNNHNGGSIKFGPDGFLYIGMGDGGSSGDPGNRSQNPNELLGKMLRIDVDSTLPYGIPSTNPYAGDLTFRKEIWAVGLRNPWKFSFDKTNGDLWIADVGQKQIEEINKVNSTIAGLNYGWNCFEGNSVYSGCSALPINYTFPIAQYDHTLGCSITGGYVYNGSKFSNFKGKYFFADYCSNKIGLLNSDAVIKWTQAFAGANFSTFGEDSDGELYVASLSAGTIYKIEDTSLAINLFDKNDIELYPNPANKEFYIKTNSIQFPSMLKITNVLGKVVLNITLQNNSKTINTDSLQKGMYIVTIKENSGIKHNAKLLIN